MIKRFVFPLEYEASKPSSSVVEELPFEDFGKLLSVSWVGKHEDNIDIEIRTKDGKDVILDMIPIAYLKLGNGREEMVIDRVISSKAVSVKTVFQTGANVKGALVFTTEK